MFSKEDFIQWAREKAKIAEEKKKQQRAYQLWYYEGPEYFGANLGAVALARCRAEAVLKLYQYVYENATGCQGPISILDRALENDDHSLEECLVKLHNVYQRV
jgi:hypothetical protein